MALSQNQLFQQDMPLVSVVTPSFNAGRYLRATIESVLQQNYSNLEHLVMDGGSTDNTRHILESYPHLKWVSEKDRGQSHALNKGLQRATGQIIGWLNADDTYEPHAILTAVQYFREHDEADMVCSDVNIIDEKGEKIGITCSRPFDTMALLTFNMVKQPTVFMRRKVIETLAGVNEQYHYVMDREFWLRAGMAGFSVHYINGITLANFRLCEGTKSFMSGPAFQEEWYHVMVKAFDDPFFAKIPLVVKRHAISENKAAFHLAKMIEAIDKRDRTEMLRRFYKAVFYKKALLVNLGFWRFIAIGLAGNSIDKLRKIKKSKTFIRESS